MVYLFVGDFLMEALVLFSLKVEVEALCRGDESEKQDEEGYDASRHLKFMKFNIFNF